MPPLFMNNRKTCFAKRVGAIAIEATANGPEEKTKTPDRQEYRRPELKPSRENKEKGKSSLLASTYHAALFVILASIRTDQAELPISRPLRFTKAQV